MADSPEKNSIGPVKLTLKVNGQEAESDVRAVSVLVSKEMNKVPFAKIVLLDGDMPNKDFPVSNKDDFKPGAEVEINAGYGTEETLIFKGIVVRHGIKISGDNYGRLTVECRDKAVKMTVGRKNANFVDKKDSDIISTLIGNAGGLSADVAATTVTHKELVQYYCSDWDFMLSRAEANGLTVNVNDAKVSVKAPEVSGSAPLAVTYGLDLYDFQADMDARSQLTSVAGACWDHKTQAVITEKVTPQALNAQGNITSDDLAKVASPSAFQLQTVAPLDQSALKAWVEGCRLKAGLARIRGTMKFQGNAKAEVGKLIDAVGVGERFSGSVFITGVHHTIADGDWTTEVAFGLAPEWFAERRDLVAPSAAGLLPGVDGLQVGVVMKHSEDPVSAYRVQVSVPVLQAETQGVWARLASSYASDGFGTVFIPEIGDEVVLGYFNNDPSHPVILGSLYSGKRKPPEGFADEKNNIKTVLTRSKLVLTFDEEKKSVTIATPAKNTVVINDDEKSVLLKDQSGNSVTLDPDGITMDCVKDVKVTAKGKVSIDAVGAISVSSKADVKITGLNVTAEADVGLTAKGSATAELSASGRTTVKGAMVMIN